MHGYEIKIDTNHSCRRNLINIHGVLLGFFWKVFGVQLLAKCPIQQHCWDWSVVNRVLHTFDHTCLLLWKNYLGLNTTY